MYPARNQAHTRGRIRAFAAGADIAEMAGLSYAGMARGCHPAGRVRRRRLAYEAQLFAALFGTQDQKEGMAAFLAKRTPEFTGE